MEKTVPNNDYKPGYTTICTDDWTTEELIQALKERKGIDTFIPKPSDTTFIQTISRCEIVGEEDISKTDIIICYRKED